MAKAKGSVTISNKVVLFIMLGVVVGFIAGFLFAKHRYIAKIRTISQSHMQKAVTIDSLEAQLKVLGASTEKK